MVGAALERKTMTVVFTDIVKSTAITREREEWFIERRRADFAEFARLVQHWRGRVVKNLGDGLLCVFESTADAMRCAIAMQRHADEQRLCRDANGLIVAGRHRDALYHRIGVHVGETYPEGDDVFGDAVNLAKRYEENSWPNAIHYSEVVRQTISASIPLQPQACRVYFKGIAEPQNTYLLWSNVPALQIKPDAWNGTIVGFKQGSKGIVDDLDRKKRRRGLPPFRIAVTFRFAITFSLLAAALVFLPRLATAGQIKLAIDGYIRSVLAPPQALASKQKPIPEPTTVVRVNPVVKDGGKAVATSKPVKKTVGLPGAPLSDWWEASASGYDYDAMVARFDSDEYQHDGGWNRAKSDAGALAAFKKWALEAIANVPREAPLSIVYTGSGVDRKFKIFSDVGQSDGQLTMIVGAERGTTAVHPDEQGGNVATSDEEPVESTTELFPGQSGGDSYLSFRDNYEILKALAKRFPSKQAAAIPIFARIHGKYGPD